MRVCGILLFVMSAMVHSTTLAFCFAPRHGSRTSRIIPPCFAKPPPTLNFDLDAIEAFEEQLEPNDITILSDEEEDVEFDADCGEIKEYVIPDELHNKRIDAAIAKLEPALSRSHCGNLITDGHVRIVGQKEEQQLITTKSTKVQSGMKIMIQLPAEEKPTEIIAQDLPLEIIFEDEHMIVLNKAANMVVHPAAGNWDGTVVNALAYYLANASPYGSGDFVDVDGSVDPKEAEGISVDGTEGEAVSFRPGIVHRLDKGTTGVLVVARTRAALATLSEAFAARKVKKTYIAVTVGNPGKRVVIDKPIGRHPTYRQRMRVVPDPHKKNSNRVAPKDRITSTSVAGRRALSFVDTLAFDGKLSVVQVRIETGRTHQIRVHLQDRHTPVYGDDIYGLTDWNKRLSKTHKIARPLLHAQKLEIDHPVTGKHMVFLAPLADDMLRIATTVWPQGKTERPDLFVEFIANEDSP